jgi:hypothetical protein
MPGRSIFEVSCAGSPVVGSALPGDGGAGRGRPDGNLATLERVASDSRPDKLRFFLEIIEGWRLHVNPLKVGTASKFLLDLFACDEGFFPGVTIKLACDMLEAACLQVSPLVLDTLEVRLASLPKFITRTNCLDRSLVRSAAHLAMSSLRRAVGDKVVVDCSVRVFFKTIDIGTEIKTGSLILNKMQTMAGVLGSTCTDESWWSLSIHYKLL